MVEEGKTLELESIPVTKEQSKKWYEEISYNDVKIFIHSNIKAASRSFIAIGYYLKFARDNRLYEEDGHASIWDFAREEYGISKSTASRYMTMNDRFSRDGNSPIIADEYKEFGKSQLQEMLYLTNEQMEGVTPTTQIKQIRELRQSAKEIPYFEIPGQINISDFPSVMPDHAIETPTTHAGSWTLSLEDFSDKPTIAVSQQPKSVLEKEPEAVADSNYCDLKPEPNVVMSQPVPDKEYVHEQYRLQELYLYPFAKWLIHNHKEWFLADYRNRVTLVDKSEPELKKYLGASGDGSREYGFPVTCFTKAYARLYNNRIELTQFEGDEMIDVGTCKWFYLSAAVQVMWNEVALEEAQALRKKTEPEPAIDTPEADEIVVDTDSCPPNNSSCRRQEWGTGPEEQAAGHKECVKCWADWKRLQKVMEESTVPAIEEMEDLIPDCEEEDGGFKGFPKDELHPDPGEKRQTQEAEPDAGSYERVDCGTDSKLSVRDVLEKENKDLEEWLVATEDIEPDKYPARMIERKRIIVEALETMAALSDSMEPKEQTKSVIQPELPLLKNNAQRAAFVDAYETWPLWIETEQTGERYYRYDLPDDSSMVVKVYHSRLFDYDLSDLPWEERYTEGYGQHEYYLLREGKFFRDCETNRTTLIEKLKEIQKKERE